MAWHWFYMVEIFRLVVKNIKVCLGYTLEMDCHFNKTIKITMRF